MFELLLNFTDYPTLKPKTVHFSLSLNYRFERHILSLTFPDYLAACPEVIYKINISPWYRQLINRCLWETYNIFCFINITPDFPDWVLSLVTDSKIEMNLILKGKRLRIKAKYVYQIALSLYIPSSPPKEVWTNQEKCLSMKNLPLFHGYTENSPRVYYCSDKFYTSPFHFLIFLFKKRFRAQSKHIET